MPKAKGGSKGDKFTPEALAKLANGLTLNGNPLQPPHMHKVDWTDGQKFT